MTRLLRASRQVQFAWRALGAVLVLLAGMSTPASAQLPTPPDTARIVNTAAYRFIAPDGSTVTGFSSADVLLQHQAGLTLTPSRSQAAPAGVRRVLAHVLRNTGTAADAFAVAAAAPAGWTVTIYMDANANGLLDAGEPVAPAVIALARDASAALLLAIDIPASAVGSFVGVVTLDGTSQMNNTVRAALQDRITIVAGASASGLALDKTVDRAAGVVGDTLLYTLAYINAGVVATSPATISDVLPRGARIVAGSMRIDGAALTDAVDADAGQVTRDASGVETIRVAVGSIPVSGGGVVTFRAVITTDAAAGTLANVATLDDGTAPVTSQPATTTITLAMLSLSKTLVGLDSAGAGDLVTYRLVYANSSATVAASGVTIVDTLPVGLTFVSADGSPAVAGQVITWNVGTLGQQGITLNIVARAVRPSTTGFINRAHMNATNAAGISAAANALRVAGWPSNLLGLTMTAQVLDVAIGEPVPYTLVLRNLGTASLTGFVVRDILPDGMRFVPASLTGADSARVTGQLLTIWMTSTLAASEQRTVRFAAVLGSAGANRALINRAMAEAESGLVVSDTAAVSIRVRAGYAMQGRSLVGKVYLDRNDNGQQDAGEEGVADARIRTADGQVVTADKEGRYSLRDVAPGTHALRIDTLTAIPVGFGLARVAEEIAMVRTDGWTTPRADFRLVPRAVKAPCECPDSTTLATAGATVRLAAALTAPRVAPLRSAAERDAEDRNAFISGPGVRITSPMDGAIVATNKVYVGVKGEAGATVTLYEGTRKIGAGVLRPDGVQDFIGVDLTPGPHRLRARIVNSWKNERWDSVSVHRSGSPATLEVIEADTTKALALRIDADTTTRVRVRVLDAWNIPVATQPHLTVESTSAALEGVDSDAGSLGQQRRADANGIVVVSLRAGHTVGDGQLIVRAGDKLMARRALRVLPTLRTLTAVGAGQVGVGAATESFGAATVHGSIGHETSLSMSYDSRRGTATDFFGRGYDPLDEARYATYGDGSTRRVVSAATQRFSARLERGLDWLELGDVVARPATSQDALLAGYQRSLSGVSTRLSAGALTMRGFGSLTRQSLAQQQLRGDGGSGPYVFGAGARPGTDRITIEVRARDNASRVIARETLTRFSDYEIDYVTGAVLLRRPVPADDAYGNPVFVVAALEREMGGVQHFVGGGRLEANVSRLVGAAAMDSVVLAVTGVRDGSASAATTGATDIMGTDVRIRVGTFAIGGEMLRTTSADSSGRAERASVRWTLPSERASIGGHWMRVGEGMSGTLDPRLGAGVTELHVDGMLRLSDSTRLRLAHDRQHFAQYDIDRQVTTVSAKTNVAGRAVTQELGLSTDVQGAGAATASALTGKTTVAVLSRVDAWIEGTRALREPTTAIATPTRIARPDHMGGGLAYRVTPGLRLEATHRIATMPDSVGGESTRYAVSAFNLRTSALFGGEAWGGVERAGATRASHAAVLGWNQRLAVGGGWAVRTLYERRVGLSRASLVDPARALPFARVEGDRWSAGGGLEWLPTSDHSRFSLNGEARDGDGRRGNRITLSGDAPMGAGAALITLHDWSRFIVTAPTLAGQQSRQDRSLVGMAIRPVTANTLNVLGKLEWRRTLNPLSGAAGASTVLGSTGEDKRLLGAADAIWAATSLTEFAARYAVRWSANDQVIGPTGAAIGIRSQYIGGRVQQALRRDGVVALRTDARMLVEQSSGAAPWSVAPSLALRVGPRLEVEGGYRLGDLLDRDFAANGGSGAFATFGVRLTEQFVRSPAGFWRDRLTEDR